jgi:hypothetical protein
MKTLNPYLAADANTLRGKIDGTVKVGKEINDPMVQFMIKVMSTMGVVPNEKDENEVEGYQLYTAIAKFIQKESWGEKKERHSKSSISINASDNTFSLEGATIIEYIGINTIIEVWIRANDDSYYQASFTGVSATNGGDRLKIYEENGEVKLRLYFSESSFFMTPGFSGFKDERVNIFIARSTQHSTIF